MRLLSTLIWLIVALNCAYATDYYLSTCGNDELRNGAKVFTNQYLLYSSDNLLAAGKQNVSAHMIDRDSKRLHRSTLVKFRTIVLIQDLTVQSTRLNRICWEVKDSRITGVDIRECDTIYYVSKLGNTDLIGARKNSTIN